MADEKKYLEGNYDGEPVQQAVQMTADVVRANKAQKEIRETQKRAYEIFEDECIDLEGITSEEFERKMETVDKNDSLHQYLVDGALLTCTMATLDDFEVDNETSVKLEIETLEEGEKRRQTFLSVMENAMYIGESCYATVKDTIINRNIFPFRCNCRQKADRMSEIERIKNNIADCRENGVCQYLICLNEEWDNMLLSDGKTYQMHRNIKAVDSVSGAGWLIGGIDTEIEDVEGITRTSVLFCKHGGLIVPLTSGQDSVAGKIILNSDTAYALACTSDGEHSGSLTWEQKKTNAEYIYNYLFEKNWSKEAICGLLGNVYRESKMNPGVWHNWNNPNSAYGIVQWTDGAFLKHYKYTKEDVDRMALEDPVKLLNNQLDCLIEMMKPEYRVWGTGNRQKQYDKYPPSEGVNLEMTGKEYTTSSDAPEDLALVFQASFERSGDGVKELQERIDAAAEWYRYFSGEDVCETDFP